jgi:hypothetical protein
MLLPLDAPRLQPINERCEARPLLKRIRHAPIRVEDGGVVWQRVQGQIEDVLVGAVVNWQEAARGAPMSAQLLTALRVSDSTPPSSSSFAHTA